MPLQHRQAEQHSADQFLARVQAVKRAIDRLFLGLGYLAGMLFTALAFFITYDVIARKWGMPLAFPPRASLTKSAVISWP